MQNHLSRRSEGIQRLYSQPCIPKTTHSLHHTLEKEHPSKSPKRPILCRSSTSKNQTTTLPSPRLLQQLMPITLSFSFIPVTLSPCHQERVKSIHNESMIKSPLQAIIRLGRPFSLDNVTFQASERWYLSQGQERLLLPTIWTQIFCRT